MKDDYELSVHAKDVMEQRKITIEYLERALFDPKLKEPDKSDPELEHRLKPIQENENRVLRVIVNIITSPIRVVTMFYDRKMRGKV